WFRSTMVRSGLPSPVVSNSYTSATPSPSVSRTQTSGRPSRLLSPVNRAFPWLPGASVGSVMLAPLSCHTGGRRPAVAGIIPSGSLPRRAEHVVGVQDGVRVPLLGQEPLPVRGVLGVDG